MEGLHFYVNNFNRFLCTYFAFQNGSALRTSPRRDQAHPTRVCAGGQTLDQPITDLAHALQVAEVPAERFARFKHGETRVWDAATSRLVTEAPKEKARPRNDALAAQ
ncbi:hypothetical protein [Ralstonia psammae]|uniref:hypothetical protein n=1 Tax=Ralstonia psammae TaxID=3058598 RepID=UPI0029308D36|nr:hypothetical protein [Ralstonia sp. LMG 19083]